MTLPIDLKQANAENQEKQATDLKLGAPEAAPAKTELDLTSTVLTDKEVSGKSVEELDKLIEQASKAEAPKKDNAPKPDKEKAKAPESKEEKPKAEDKPKEQKPALDEEFRKYKENAEAFQGRQSNEIGSLRKMVEDFKAQINSLTSPQQQKQREEKDAELRERILNDPREVIKSVYNDIKSEDQNTLQEIELKRKMERSTNFETIKSRHSEILDQTKGQEIANSVVEFLKEDGYSTDELTKIQRDPFGEVPAELLHLYIIIGKQRNEIKTLKTGTKTYQDLPSKISQAAQSKSIVESAGQGVPVNSEEILNDLAVSKKSVAEIDKLLEEMQKK